MITISTNRDSVQYKDIYGLHDAHTVYRGTFRNLGWCETMRAITQIGWLNDSSIKDFIGSTYADVTRYLINANATEDLYSKTAEYLDLKPYAAVMKRLQWLGLLSDLPLPEDKETPLDFLTVLALEKMSLQKYEKDMIIMHHEFIAEYPDKKERITSTLVHYGIPEGDTAVAVTVTLPAAIAVNLILQKKIDLTGVYRPTIPEIYNPILDELALMDISFEERSYKI